ncbi:MAG: glycosyl hydrolase 115 family protein [Gemmatimonadaceae bacterium]
MSAQDFPGVIRAAGDLGTDVGRVTSIASQVIADSAPHGQVVIIGTLGKSPVIDRLAADGKIDASVIRGKWEAFVRQVVDKPVPGVDKALVIAGSDKRGTIYGIYDLSQAIGVSPWYWWADVPTQHRADLYVGPGTRTLGEPAVKYRGIFINDEAPAFSGWAREKFGGINHKVYERMFELILRLKGNYLWPAMWGNAFADDDSLDTKLADEYGIVMGTSHHEPMTRAQQEWKRYGKGPWDYGVNDSTLRDFWRAGIERMWNNGLPRENIVTIGMRGDGDRPMTTNGESNVDLLEKVVADQRKIIADVTKQDPSKTPQLWALYKEVQDYYDKGMRVPDDVTLLFSDDNWGNVRRLPSAADRNRPGGFGIYYHFDYVGGPRNYKWINTNPIARVWEQLHLTHELGANTIWIVNTGDLKPMEFPIQFFLDYAWNPNAIPAGKLPEYTRRWAEQQFGTAHAREIAEITTTYLEYAGRRKPELIDTATYSLTNYREAERVVEDYDALLARASKIANVLAPQDKDAYYELVLHPIEAASNLNDLYVTAAKNRLYALEGRASTNDLADRARKLFERDAEISRYFNTELAGSKWSHMMDQTHIGYTYWQEPPHNTMPRVDVIQNAKPADMGVAVVEQNRVPFAGRGGRGGAGGPPPGFQFGGRGNVALPTFDNYQRQTFHVDVYNRGLTPFAFTAQAAEPWVIVTPSKGSVTKEQRVSVSIDWTRAPKGDRTVPITFTGPNNARSLVNAVVSNPAAPTRESVKGFVEGNGYVSIEAEHYSRAVTSPAVTSWLTIPDLGRTLSAVEAMPVTAPSQTPGASSAHLEYTVFLFDSGTVKVDAYLSPTLNFTGAPTGLRYAVSFDDDAPQTVNVLADSSTRAWEKLVADNINITTTRHTLARPGAHVLKFWAVDPGVVLQKIVIQAHDVAPSYLGPPESFYRP